MNIKLLLGMMVGGFFDFLEDLKDARKFLLLYFLGIAIFAVALFTFAIPIQQVYYKYKARTESDRYGQCLSCHNHYPHKKMKDYNGYKWICDTEGETNNCEGLYTREYIKERINEHRPSR